MGIDARQAILDHLGRRAGELEPGPASPGGVRSAVVRGGNPFQADPSTARFLKHRESGHRWVYYVTFLASIPQLGPEPHEFDYVFPVERDGAGEWRVVGGAGGAGGAPRRPKPWINLCGGGWPDAFYAGGRIEAAGVDVARVELRFANGVTLEDDADSSVGLFITEESVQTPATAVLYDAAGDEVARHVALD